MVKATDWQQWNLSAWQVQGIRSHVVVLLALIVALSNPLACLLHCWVHAHVALLDTAPVALGIPAHAHHAAHKAAPLADQPSPSSDGADTTFCRSDHQTPSPFTVAVLLTLLLLTFWVAPGFSLPVHALFLLPTVHPPPRRPPRLTTLTSAVV